jgi:NADH dehydrogenase
MNQNYNLPRNNKKRIIIVGAGFGGLKLARLLAGSKYQVVLIDKRNFHQFQPLFYQVATSGIEPSLISFPVRKTFQKHSNLHFRNTSLLSVDSHKNEVVTEAGTIHYDFLVIASGVGTNYFGNENIQQNSISMKSTAEAINLRNRILESYEKAILTENVEEQQKMLSFTVVGGGPTGVELSGAIAELKNYVLPKDYPELDFSKMRIRLYEAGPRLLNGMSDRSGERALQFLRKLGVEVNLNTMINDYDGETITLKNGETVKSQNFIWTAGVSGTKLNGISDNAYGRANRILVDRYNRVEGYKNVYAIGDAAYMETDRFPSGHPQVAQVAIQQAILLAKNFRTDNWKPFEYKDKGSMATIGRNMAVCDLPNLHFAGRFAWLLWLFVHLMAIVGVKNRFFILVNWAQSYFLRDQSLRILIRPYRKA